MISLLYTSCRPGRVDETLMRWHRMISQGGVVNVEFILSHDYRDVKTKEAMESCADRYFDTILCINAVLEVPPGPRSCVRGWNRCAEMARGDILICISDDFYPPEDWDEKIMNCADAGWWNEDHAVMVSDGCTPQGALLMTLPIITRERYRKLGYVLHPDYLSMYCDNEAAEHAINDGAFIDARGLLFEHRHFVNAKRQHDGFDDRHSSAERMECGRRIFEARRSLGFPKAIGNGDSIPNKWIAYLQVAGDDIGLLAICQRLLDSGVTDFFFSVPSHTWDGEAIIEEKSRQVWCVASQLSKQIGVRVYSSMPDVKKLGVGLKKALDIETRVRNRALEEISSLGYGHILIVDGDELWSPTLVYQLTGLILRERPPYVYTHGIPVVGVPGYPVEGATDGIGIYIRADNRFLSCRSPYHNAGHVIAGAPVIHFSCVRRSREQLIAKLRQSGHYDDPNYRFEDWIKRTLPKIRPGAKNVHMYSQGKNIWPVVRNWRANELADIPETIRQYLA